VRDGLFKVKPSSSASKSKEAGRGEAACIAGFWAAILTGALGAETGAGAAILTGALGTETGPGAAELGPSSAMVSRF
jgi:hypothetical protein